MGVLAAGALAALSAALVVPANAAQPDGPPGRSKREDTIRYWTAERVAHAKERDMVRQAPAKGKPGGGGGGSTTTTGATWTKGGKVQETTGKVLFTLSGVDYVCSGSVVDNAQAGGRSVVLTAGHCVADGGGGPWATNWVFMPNWQDSPHDYVCATTRYGCWTADALVSSSAWVSSGDFSYDVAFAVVSPGGRSASDALDLDAVVGTQAIAFNLGRSSGVSMHSFGYPKATPYTGNILTYCAGSTRLDLYSYDSGLGCTMTGGSSGGPWYRSFNETTGTGVTSSVNSFKYSNDNRTMYGPYFGNYAQAVYTAATGYGGSADLAVAAPASLP